LLINAELPPLGACLLTTIPATTVGVDVYQIEVADSQ
jgi:hypothetical protein